MTLRELQEKMQRLSTSLLGWEKSTFGHVRRELQSLEKELEKLRNEPGHTGPSHAELKIVERVLELHHREEIMWKQRARIEWLRAGDKNTRFFYLRVTRRRRKNLINTLRKPDGHTTEDPQEMASLATSFYRTLYMSEGTENMETVLSTVPIKVSADMNNQLLAEIKTSEIKDALFQMFPTKAPGPDGYPAHFFQRHWNLCGEEVTSVVMRVLRGEDNPASINNTFIVLIPKVRNPVELGQFRPISLCNVIYKIASKVLANRLKLLLPEIVSEEQSAFVRGD